MSDKPKQKSTGNEKTMSAPAGAAPPGFTGMAPRKTRAEIEAATKAAIAELRARQAAELKEADPRKGVLAQISIPLHVKWVAHCKAAGKTQSDLIEALITKEVG